MSIQNVDSRMTVATWLPRALAQKLSAKRPATSLEALRKELLAALPAHLKAKKDELSTTRVTEVLDALYWETNGRTDIFKNAIKAGYDAQELHALLAKHWHSNAPMPPVWVVEEKLKDMHGRTSAPRTASASLPGILRAPVAKAKAYALADTEFGKPFHALPTNRKREELLLTFIPAPQLGLPYNPDIVQNALRSGFSAARKMGSDAVVIGGGLFRLSWLKTTGPNRLLTDLVTGTEIDFESIDKAYRPELMRIIESGSFEPIFVTAVEQLNDLLRGWYKVTRRPGNRPEFEGPVYIVLNSDDLGIVRRMAYFELLYQQHQKMLEAQAEARLHAKLAAEAHGEGDTEGYEEAKAQAEEASRLAMRFRMTNLDPSQNRRVYDQALSYLIERIEESIAGAKVVDQNAAYLRFGWSKDIIKILSAGDVANPHVGELRNMGPAQRRSELPALTVSMHPRATWMRQTAREDYLNGSMTNRMSVGFVEAPMLVDPMPIFERTRGTKVNLPVVKTVSDPMFAPGMLIVRIHPVLGISSDVVPLETVRKLGAPQRGRPPAHAKYMWWILSTDMHLGAVNRLFLKRPTGIPIGVSEAALELMQRDGLSASGAAPVVGFIAADDLVQGNHFGTHLRPHHNRRSNAAVLDEADARLRAAAVLSGTEREEALRALVLDEARQILVRTPDHLGSQFIELREGLLIPYRRTFAGILLKARETGVVVRGVSYYAKTQFDTRDVGLINFGSGNHATKTVDGMLYEGDVTAALLRALLLNERGMKGFNLETLVRAPLFQDRSIGYGRIMAGDDGYEWGLHISSSPPRRDSWDDVLHGWVQVNKRIGNPSTMLEHGSTLHVTGDKHFFATAFAGGDLYVMGSSATHTDAFAYIAGGLPENNAGVTFIGLPVDGPDAAELSVRHLKPALMQEFLSSGKPFPWKDFLPHSV